MSSHWPVTFLIRLFHTLFQAHVLLFCLVSTTYNTVRFLQLWIPLLHSHMCAHTHTGYLRNRRMWRILITLWHMKHYRIPAMGDFTSSACFSTLPVQHSETLPGSTHCLLICTQNTHMSPAERQVNSYCVWLTRLNDLRERCGCLLWYSQQQRMLSYTIHLSARPQSLPS